MKKKVILISIDGMRPDGLMGCGNPYVRDLLQNGTYTLTARTVYPSITLPCHMSMMHSLTPQEHGIMRNVFTGMKRPVNGIFEQVAEAGGSTAMFFNWLEQRDLCTTAAAMITGYVRAEFYENTDAMLTKQMLAAVKAYDPDFTFLHLVETDELGGHAHGWMSEEYLRRLSLAVDCVKEIMDAVGDTHTVLVTADHGGHGDDHGSDLPEDMTIPMVFTGPDFIPGRELTEVSILDLAPTIAAVMGIAPAPEWTGKPLI